MSAKFSSVQQTPRRTPLSLSTSMKPVKPNDKSDNNKNDNKKETTNNQKTDNLKKDSQQDRKLSADKKQQSTESKRSSSTSSSDSKKQEDSKTNRNDDKKSQNGVNGNSIKEKPNTNEAGAKAKLAESSSNGSTSKKDVQKPTEKKKEPVATEEATAKNDNKDKSTDKSKTTKTEDNNKNKTGDKNKIDPSKLDQEKTKEKKLDVKVNVEKIKNDEKSNEEKNVAVKSTEKTPAKEEIIEQEVVIISLLDTTEKELSLIEKNAEEATVSQTTPIKEKTNDETPNLEKPVQEESEDVEMMEPLQVNEGEESPSPKGTTNIFAVSTPAKVSSPKQSLHLFEGPSKLSPKSEVKPPREPMTHTPDRKSCPRTFSAISGRRSIRPIGDYTFSGNLQIRESYRKINTELDFTSSSMNVTVGSEVPNNESFSFFSRSRKRDRSSPSHQSSTELPAEISPKSPKRAKIDLGMTGFFNAMASPITMLRARLARATVQSTPKKQIVDSIEKEIVENVSAIVVDEDLTATEEQTFNNPDSTVADTNEQCGVEALKFSPDPVVEENYDDIKIKETITATDSQAKKRCNIM